MLCAQHDIPAAAVSSDYVVKISARRVVNLLGKVLSGKSSRSVQSSEMSLLVLSLSIAVATSEMIAQPRMKMAIAEAE